MVIESYNLQVRYRCTRLKKDEVFKVQVLKEGEGDELEYTISLHNVELNNLWGSFTIRRHQEEWLVDNDSEFELDTLRLLTGCDIIALNRLTEEETRP